MSPLPCGHLLAACRAGAEMVTAVESVRHMAETATSCVVFNGYSKQIHVVHRDGRFLKLGRDMQSPADLLVFEVRAMEFINNSSAQALWRELSIQTAHEILSGTRAIALLAK